MNKHHSARRLENHIFVSFLEVTINKKTMGDNINQKNVFGANKVKTSNTIIKVFANHRVQGFIAGILTSIIASIIYDFIK